MPENDQPNVDESPQVEDAKPYESSFLTGCYIFGAGMLFTSVVIGLIRGVRGDFYFFPLMVLGAGFVLEKFSKFLYRTMERVQEKAKPDETELFDQIEKSFEQLPIILGLPVILFPLFVVFAALTMNVQ